MKINAMAGRVAFIDPARVLTLALALVLALALAGCGGQQTTRTVDSGARPDRAERTDEPADDTATVSRREQRQLQRAVDAAGNVVYFDFDKSTLTPQTREVLDKHIALLQTNSESVRINGHTDERGTREYNIALGERRARAVLAYLRASGIASYRMEAVSYGEERPVARGSGEANWRQNRRVEIE